MKHITLLSLAILAGCTGDSGRNSTPVPTPKPSPVVVSEPAPIPVPEPTSSPVVVSEPVPVPAPTPKPTPQPSPTPVAHSGPDYPRTMGMNIGAKNYDDASYQAQLAKTDFAILGFYPQWKVKYSYGGYTGIRAAVAGIKAKNHNVILGQYTILQDANPSITGPNLANADTANKVNSMNWWLRDSSGSQKTWTSQFSTYDVNITDYTRPDAQGLRYPEWLAQRNNNMFFKPVPEFEIAYFDNVFERSRIKSADWSLDGVNESNLEPTGLHKYRMGHVNQWRRVSELNPKLLLVGNTDHDLTMPEYKGKLNGAFFEAAMGESWSVMSQKGWPAMMKDYRGMMVNTKSPHLVGFNVHGSVTDYRLMRFGLTSTLLDDGYFCFTDKAVGYSSVPWFDELNANLGWPTQGAQTIAWKDGVYRRNFENGVVLVNPTSSSVTVSVGTGLKHISGTQVPSLNNGKSVTSVTIPGQDGVILIKEGS